MPDLSRTPSSPIYEIVHRILAQPDFKNFDIVKAPEIVPTKITFDLYNFAPDHPARSHSDTYFIDDTNTGGNSIRNAELYQRQVAKLWDNYGSLKREVQEDTSFFATSEGYETLVEYERFFYGELGTGGLTDFDNKMQQSILNPDPTKQTRDAYDYYGMMQEE